jgi:uncharacterized DUF497 family protein
MASLEFEWDEAKNKANITKHGVGFARASAVFRDAFAIEYLDDRGMANNRLLTVVYTPRGDTNRLISAREATTLEKRRYHEENH